MRIAQIILLWMVAFCTGTFAKVVPGPFEDLVLSSDLIVVAKVEAVTKPERGAKYATAAISEVWKGSAPRTIHFRASSGGTNFCDRSHAVEGEVVLLFLIREGAAPVSSYRIARSGLGRLPLLTENGKPYLDFDGHAYMPPDTPTVAIPHRNRRMANVIDLAVVRTLVRNLITN